LKVKGAPLNPKLMGLVQLMEPTNGTFEVIASRKERKKERKEQTGAHLFSFYRSEWQQDGTFHYLLVHSTTSPTFLNR